MDHQTVRGRGPVRPAAVLAAFAVTLGAATLGASPAFAEQAPAADHTITGPSHTAFGSTASQVRCDVNGDGEPDLAVGTYATFDSDPSSTAAYVLLGIPGAVPQTGHIDDAAAVRIFETGRNMMGGVDVRCAGDVNGDGIDDLVAVAQATGAFVIFGSKDFTDLSLDALGERGRTVFGSITRANGVGDIDGDGLDEIAVTDTSGGVTVLNVDELVAEQQLGDTRGTRISGAGIDLVSVSRAGDMNGDGREDLAVGASSWRAPGAERFATGAVWVLTDTSADVTVGAAAVPGFRVDGAPRGYDLIGTATVGLGDINGDGFDDLMIGGESDEPLSGSAIVVTGGPDGRNVVTNPLVESGWAVSDAESGEHRGWWLNGISSGDHFGHAVGAVRMDGWAMLLAGAMDGSPNQAATGSGYAVAVDSRALVSGTAGASTTGVFEAASLLAGVGDEGEPKGAAAGSSAADRPVPVTPATLIVGSGAEQHLGRSFADLTADPAGERVTFAIGAPALFSDTDPSVRIIGLDAPVKAQETPGSDANASADGDDGTDSPGGDNANTGGDTGTGGDVEGDANATASADAGDAGGADGAPGNGGAAGHDAGDRRGLASTGSGTTAWAASAALLAAAAGVIALARRRARAK